MYRYLYSLKLKGCLASNRVVPLPDLPSIKMTSSTFCGIHSISARGFGRRYLFGWSSAVGVKSNVVIGGAAHRRLFSRPSHRIINGSSHHHQHRHRYMRHFHGTPNRSSLSSSTFRERLVELRRNGKPEIIFGSIILTLAGIDYILQRRSDKEKDDMFQQLEREVKIDEESTRKEERLMLLDGAAHKSKFQCIIRKVPQNFDGHKCLKNVKVGDVVGIIEEGVGPGGQYNLCSIERTTAAKSASQDSTDNDSSEEKISIGWFPCSCLQKIEQK